MDSPKAQNKTIAGRVKRRHGNLKKTKNTGAGSVFAFLKKKIKMWTPDFWLDQFFSVPFSRMLQVKMKRKKPLFDQTVKQRFF
jgi:hypothetical protein